MNTNSYPITNSSADKEYRFYRHERYLQQRETCVTKGVKKLSHIERLKQLADNFEEAAKIMIPEAEQWDEQAWSDVRNIVASIQNRYGEDSVSILENFDEIITYLDYRIRKNRSNFFFAHVIEINDIPPSLQRRIWPKDTVESVCRLFLSTCHWLSKGGCCEAIFMREPFKESWLYRQVQTWIAEEVTFKDPQKIRKAFFDVTLLPC